MRQDWVCCLGRKAWFVFSFDNEERQLQRAEARTHLIDSVSCLRFPSPTEAHYLVCLMMLYFSASVSLLVIGVQGFLRN